jgi:hypothetical protein
MIPAFTMPTNPSKIIKFNVPTVQVCIDYADLSPDMEQEIATGYLDRLNDAYDSANPLTSSLYWTMQDRKTALYWIYLYITDDTSVNTSYQCRCGEVHSVEFDMQDMAEHITSGELAKSPVQVLGDDFEYRIVPLYGWGEQHLEEMRLLIDDEATARQKTDIKVMRTLLQVFPVAMTNTPIPKLIEYLVSLKETLTIADYRRLSNDIYLYDKEHSFGLQMSVNSVGEASLLAPTFDCENEDKEVSATIKTRLSVPFWSYNYITTL